MEIKKGLIQEYEEQLQEEANQEKLREKYDVPDENVKIVEKKTTLQFLVRTAGVIIRTIFGAALIALAAAGLIAMIYPAPRAELLKVLLDAWNQILSYL